MTTTELTERYINEHRSIKECLKKGLINYSSLARLIAKDLEIENKASKEAILIAARRFKDKIKTKIIEEDIVKLFRKSNMEIKNNIVFYTLEKNIFPDSLVEIEKTIKKNNDLFFAIEGTKSITVIIQRQNKELVEKKFRNNIIRKKENLSLITISSPGIEKTPGAVNYLTGILFDNGVNIEEFMSCYHDTLILIETKDIGKVINLFDF